MASLHVKLDIGDVKQNTVVTTLINNLNGTIADVMNDDVTHYICNTFRVSFNSLMALINCIPIVTPTYLADFLDDYRPDPSNYLPDSKGICHPRQLLPNKLRQVLFEQYTFTFREKGIHDMNVQLISPAGGQTICDPKSSHVLKVTFKGTNHTLLEPKQIRNAIINCDTSKFIRQSTHTIEEVALQKLDLFIDNRWPQLTSQAPYVYQRTNVHDTLTLDAAAASLIAPQTAEETDEETDEEPAKETDESTADKPA